MRIVVIVLCMSSNVVWGAEDLRREAAEALVESALLSAEKAGQAQARAEEAAAEVVRGRADVAALREDAQQRQEALRELQAANERRQNNFQMMQEDLAHLQDAYGEHRRLDAQTIGAAAKLTEEDLVALGRASRYSPDEFNSFGRQIGSAVSLGLEARDRNFRTNFTEGLQPLVNAVNNSKITAEQVAAAVQAALEARPAPVDDGAPHGARPLFDIASATELGNAVKLKQEDLAVLGQAARYSPDDLKALGAAIGTALPPQAAPASALDESAAQQLGNAIGAYLSPGMKSIEKVVEQLGKTAWYVPTGGTSSQEEQEAQAEREAAMRAKVKARLEAELYFAEEMAAQVKKGQIKAEMESLKPMLEADLAKRKKLLELKQDAKYQKSEEEILAAEEAYEAARHARKLELQKNSLEMQDKMHARKWENLQKMFAAAGTGMKDPKRMALLAATAGGGAAAIYGSRLAMRQLEIYLNRPKLVRETSDRGLLRRMFGVRSKKGVTFADMVLSPQLEAKLKRVMESAVHAYKHGTNLPNVGLFGPPGTGKTMFIEALAYQSGMMYAKMTGGDVSALLSSGGQNVAVTEIHKLFDWLEAHGPAVLLVDEADAFLRNGRDGKLSEGLSAAINAFLSRTGSSSSRVMLVFATNYPQSLDGAVQNRVSTWIFVDRPSRIERQRLIKHELEKLVANGLGRYKTPVALDQSVNEGMLEKLAKRTEGFAGRDIKMKLIDPLEREMARREEFEVTAELLNSVLDTTLEQEREFSKWVSGDRPDFNGIASAVAQVQ